VVKGPTIPSGERPLEVWNLLTAARVFGPNIESPPWGPQLNQSAISLF